MSKSIEEIKEELNSNESYRSCPMEDSCSNQGTECNTCMWNLEGTTTDNYEGELREHINNGELDEFMVS